MSVGADNLELQAKIGVVLEEEGQVAARRWMRDMRRLVEDTGPPVDRLTQQLTNLEEAQRQGLVTAEELQSFREREILRAQEQEEALEREINLKERLSEIEAERRQQQQMEQEVEREAQKLRLLEEQELAYERQLNINQEQAELERQRTEAQRAQEQAERDAQREAERLETMRQQEESLERQVNLNEENARIERDRADAEREQRDAERSAERDRQAAVGNIPIAGRFAGAGPFAAAGIAMATTFGVMKTLLQDIEENTRSGREIGVSGDELFRVTEELVARGVSVEGARTMAREAAMLAEIQGRGVGDVMAEIIEQGRGITSDQARRRFFEGRLGTRELADPRLLNLGFDFAGIPMGGMLPEVGSMADRARIQANLMRLAPGRYANDFFNPFSDTRRLNEFGTRATRRRDDKRAAEEAARGRASSIRSDEAGAPPMAAPPT